MDGIASPTRLRRRRCISRTYGGFTTNAAGDITYQGTSEDDSLDQTWLDAYLDTMSLP